MINDTLKIFSGNSNIPLCEKIVDAIGFEMGKIEISCFSDGETLVKILDNVRGMDIFIVQSTSRPVNNFIVELLLLIDAFRRASARRITVVMPYYGYSRQERKSEPRVPISAKVVANIIEITGADRILCMDLHADPIQGFFDIPVDHLFAAPMFIKYVRTLSLKPIVIVSPDTGGTERARFFAKHLDSEIAIVDKRRHSKNQSEVMNIVGDVSNKHCIIVDDIIDTAGTVCKAGQALTDAGALSVRVLSTHGVLSGNAQKRIEQANIEEVIITDSIQLPGGKLINKIRQISVASLIGEAILRIHNEESVSSLFV